MPRPLIVSLLTLSQQAPSSPTRSNNTNNREISPAPHCNRRGGGAVWEIMQEGGTQAWESSEVTREFTVTYYGSGWERVSCYRESTLRTAASQTRVKVLTMGSERPHLFCAGREKKISRRREARRQGHLHQEIVNWREAIKRDVVIKSL